MQFLESSTPHPSRKKVANTFGLKAAQYEQFALFQAETLDYLIFHFGEQIKNDQYWLDLGCGTGIFSKKLIAANLAASVTGVDISMDSLRKGAHIQQHSVQADIEDLPFKESSIDGLVIASVIQWVADIKECICKFKMCLKKGGIVLFSVFIDKSFFELNMVKQSLGLPIAVSLPSPERFEAIMRDCDLSILKSNILEHTYFFPSAIEALKSISSYGATAVSGLLQTKIRILELCTEYERLFKNSDGTPITYKAITGIAIKE